MWNRLQKLEIPKLTKRSFFEGNSASSLSSELSQGQFEELKDDNGNSTVEVLPQKVAHVFSGQCKMYIRPIDFNTKNNDIQESQLLNPSIYTKFTGGASIYINVKENTKTIITTAHQIADTKYIDGDSVKMAHKETKDGDIVLLKCSSKTFFAKVREYGQKRVKDDNDENINLINAGQAVDMDSDFDDDKDYAKLDPINSNGEIDLEMLKDLKPIAMMKVLVKDKFGPSIFATSDKYGYVVQFQGSLKSKDGTHTFDSDNFYRTKSKCKIMPDEIAPQSLTAGLYNEEKILSVLCEGKVRIASGNPLYLGKADTRNNEIEQLQSANLPSVALGIIVSGDIVENKDKNQKTYTKMNVLTFGQNQIK